MLDSLKDLFNKEFQCSHIAGILQQVGNLVNILQRQFLKDHDSKNAAIDLICSMLQSYKDVPACTQGQDGNNAAC